MKVGHRRLRWALLAGFVAVITGVGAASAAFPDTNVDTFTGCLTSGGAINSVTKGLAPLGGTCASSQQIIHLSGGDITNVTAGSGLAGGGDNGAVTLSLSGSYQLPQGCAAGKFVKWDGSTWQCTDDQTYSNGTGLDLSGNAFSLNPAYQLPQGCSSGQVVQSGGSNTWSCQNAPSGSNFALSNQSCNSGQFVTGFDASGVKQCTADQTYDGSNFALSGHACSAGQFVTGISATGTPQCSSTPLPDVYHAANSNSIGGEATVTVVSVSVPAGNYSVIAHAEAVNLDSSGAQSLACFTFANGGDLDFASQGLGYIELGHWPLVGVVTLSSAGTISVRCSGFGPADFTASLNAERIGAIH